MTLPREYPVAPVVGVGALVFHGDEILLIQRGREPLKGEWSLPGGRLELGETLQDGVIREVLEETGIAVKVLRHVETLDRIFVEADERVRYHYVLVDFLCEAVGGELCCGDDAADARWFSIEEVRGGTLPIASFTVEVIRKAEKMRRELWCEEG